MNTRERQPALRALAGLGVALALAVVAWHYLNIIADAGVNRIDRIASVRSWCSEHYGRALTRDDTMHVDRMALPDTVDARASDPIDRCGDLRDEAASGVQSEPQNSREMTGEEMPRGLR